MTIGNKEMREYYYNVLIYQRACSIIWMTVETSYKLWVNLYNNKMKSTKARKMTHGEKFINSRKGKNRGRCDQRTNGTKKTKVVDLNLIISVITLNINDLNTPSQKQRTSVGTKNQNPIICCLQEIHFKLKIQIH